MHEDWRPLATYSFNASGTGDIVLVGWKSGSRIVRLGEGFKHSDGSVTWSDPYRDEALQTPDYWMPTPSLPNS